MLKPGTLIIIGTFAIVVGFMPPAVSILCVASGALCVGIGFYGLRQESKENQNDSVDED